MFVKGRYENFHLNYVVYFKSESYVLQGASDHPQLNNAASVCRVSLYMKFLKLKLQQ
jgi:hypothetical protein